MSGGITSWVIDVIDHVGALGVGGLIALENLFPPIPSEVILPLAGFTAKQGDMNVVAAWVMATLGALVGAGVLYGVGAVVGYDRLHEMAGKRWFIVMSQADLEKGHRFFVRHGGKIVLFGRCVPLVRSLVSVPAGVERMPPARFLAFTAIGSATWNAVFIGAGWMLGENWDRVEGWMTPIGYLVLGGLVGWLIRSVHRRLTRARPSDVQG
ncbi:MAG: DedA family protein [Actinobacteria bacterium]|nr:DedA family protein [Actinomycetota bacterium]